MASQATLEARLTAINLAITAVEGGAQSYSVAGMQVNRGHLAAMYSERERIEARLARLDGSRPAVARVDMSGAY
jgi:hypothetical protein